MSIDLTISNWQQCPTKSTTRVVNSSKRCDQCKLKYQPTSVVCTGPLHIGIFCWDCWTKEEWTCTTCKCQPSDKNVVGCDVCGQWTHIGCQDTLPCDSGEYTCKKCRSKSDCVLLKSNIFDLQQEVQQHVRDKQNLQDCLLDAEGVKKHLLKEIKTNRADYSHLKDASLMLETSLEQVKKTCSKHQQNVTKIVACNRMLENEFKTHQSEKRECEDKLHAFYASEIEELKKNRSDEHVANKQELEVYKARNNALENEVVKLKSEYDKFKKNNSKHLKRAREEHIDMERIYHLAKKRHVAWNTSFPAWMDNDKRDLWSKHECARRTVLGRTSYIAKNPKSSEFENVTALFDYLSRHN